MFKFSPSPGPLRLWPSISPRLSALPCRRRHHCLRLFFAVTSHPAARFIVSRLLIPRHRNWLSFAVALSLSSLPADCHLLSGARSICPPLSPTFAPSGRVLSFAVASVSAFPFALVLLSPLPRSLAFTGIHRRRILDKDAISLVLPVVFLQAQLSGSAFGGTRT